MASIIALLLACLATCGIHTAATCADDIAADSTVFVSSGGTWFHDNLGNFTLLDARGNFSNHIRTAVQAKWSAFTVSGGVLQNDTALKTKFASLGVSPGKRVVVYGGWSNGWGDEGRIHWMLKYLGHPHAYILAGGVESYKASHPEDIVQSDVSSPVPVDVSLWASGLSPMTSILAGASQITDGKALVIDTRTVGEYDGTLVEVDGKAKYGVARLGHASGAVSFPYTAFFQGGCLVSCDTFKANLTALGWSAGQKLVSYCTAGIRSAFFWSIVQHCNLGVSAANYAGSMLEYAMDTSLPMATKASPKDASAASGLQHVAGCLATASLLVAMLFGQ